MTVLRRIYSVMCDQALCLILGSIYHQVTELMVMTVGWYGKRAHRCQSQAEAVIERSTGSTSMVRAAFK